MVMSNSLSYKTGFSAISSGNMMDADGDGGQATEITFGKMNVMFTLL